jgi:chemotaxis protein MotB
MSVVHQNKWYVEPVADEETDGWLLTYLDLITLLLVLLVVMLALSGKATTSLPPAPTTSGLLPAHSGLFPGVSAPAVGPLPALVATTEWDSPAYAPSLADSHHRPTTHFVDLPAHFQAEADPDAILQHVMGQVPSVPLSTASTPAAAKPEAGGLGLLALPELGDDIEIIRNPESISFRINSEILYSSAKADLSLEGLAVLRKLFPVLKGSEHIITVEGHTDALPIRGGQYPSNWELSSARAGRVVRYLATNGIESTRLRAIGYADTRPLSSNNSEQGRASNRRVEVILEQPAPVAPR